MEALMGYQTEFVRTPKFRIEGKSDSWKHKKYRGYARTASIMIELALGCYFLFAIVFAVKFEVYASLPFLLMFGGGFFYVALLSLHQGIHFARGSDASPRIVSLHGRGECSEVVAPAVSLSDTRAIDGICLAGESTNGQP
jgi:hypothetical protein